MSTYRAHVRGDLHASASDERVHTTHHLHAHYVTGCFFFANNCCTPHIRSCGLSIASHLADCDPNAIQLIAASCRIRNHVIQSIITNDRRDHAECAHLRIASDGSVRHDPSAAAAPATTRGHQLMKTYEQKRRTATCTAIRHFSPNRLPWPRSGRSLQTRNRHRNE